MNEGKVTKVTIDGEMLELTGDDAIYLHRLAEYISDKFKEVREMRRTCPTSPALLRLLVTLNIADDYLKQLDTMDKLSQESVAFTLEAEEYMRKIEKLTKENAALKSRTDDLKNELNGARKELEDYVNAFDDSEG